MNRIALLIGQAGGFHNRLRGVTPDIQNMRHYLKSPIGGSFEDHEIITITDETADWTLYMLETYTNCDYALVYFSGHGYTATNRSHRMVQFSDKSIPDMWLLPKSKVGLVIIDACRNFREELRRYAPLNGIGDVFQEHFSVNAREVFDAIIEISQPGHAIIHGTQIGNFALDSNSGGHFTLALLDSLGDLYATSEDGNFCLLDDALQFVNDRLSSQGNAQRSVITYREGAALFPLAVELPVYS